MVRSSRSSAERRRARVRGPGIAMRTIARFYARQRFSARARFPFAPTANDRATATRPSSGARRQARRRRAPASSPGFDVRRVHDQRRRLPVGLEIDARREAVAHQERQHVVAVDPLRRRNVDLDLIVEAEHRLRPLAFPQHGIERRHDRARVDRSRNPDARARCTPAASILRRATRSRRPSSTSSSNSTRVFAAAAGRSPTGDPTTRRRESTARCPSRVPTPIARAARTSSAFFASSRRRPPAPRATAAGSTRSGMSYSRSKFRAVRRPRRAPAGTATRSPCLPSDHPHHGPVLLPPIEISPAAIGPRSATSR